MKQKSTINKGCSCIGIILILIIFFTVPNLPQPLEILRDTIMEFAADAVTALFAFSWSTFWMWVLKIFIAFLIALLIGLLFALLGGMLGPWGAIIGFAVGFIFASVLLGVLLYTTAGDGGKGGKDVARNKDLRGQIQEKLKEKPELVQPKDKIPANINQFIIRVQAPYTVSIGKYIDKKRTGEFEKLEMDKADYYEPLREKVENFLNAEKSRNPNGERNIVLLMDNNLDKNSQDTKDIEERCNDAINKVGLDKAKTTFEKWDPNVQNLPKDLPPMKSEG